MESIPALQFLKHRLVFKIFEVYEHDCNHLQNEYVWYDFNHLKQSIRIRICFDLHIDDRCSLIDIESFIHVNIHLADEDACAYDYL
jgi:hypothetical protein